MGVQATENVSGNSTFDRSYEILDAVGRGRNSVVYKARKLAPRSAREEIVALKVLLGNPKQKSFNQRRMRREALAMLACRHPNVIRLNDYVSAADVCYLSMEYADGGDLRALLESRNAPFTLEESLQLCIEILNGLEAIHRSGVIHRDIKPENILLSGRNQVKIADFGVAVLPVPGLNDDDMALGIGTFDYLAPETLQDGRADIRSDVYSVGVTLFQLLSNHLPFEGRSISSQITQKMSGAGASIRDYVTNVHPDLDALFRRALANQPGERFQTAFEFRGALERFLTGSWSPDLVIREGESHFEDERFEDQPEFHSGSFQSPDTGEYSTRDLLIETDGDGQYDSEADYGDDSVEELIPHDLHNPRARRWWMKAGLAAFATVLLFVGIQFFRSIQPPVFGPKGEQPSPISSPEHDARAMISPQSEKLLGLFRGERTGVIEHLFADGLDVAVVATPSGDNKLMFALGLIGWRPVEIDLDTLATEQKLEVQGSGIKLVLRVEQSDESEGRVISGSYREVFSGREGSWRIW